VCLSVAVLENNRGSVSDLGHWSVGVNGDAAMAAE